MSYRVNALTALPDGPIFAPTIGASDTPVGWNNIATCLNEMYKRFAPQCASESQEPEEELLRGERTHRYRFPTPIVGGMGSLSGFIVLLWGVRVSAVTWTIDVSVNGGPAATKTVPLMGAGTPTSGQLTFTAFDDTAEITEITLQRNTLTQTGGGTPPVSSAHFTGLAIVPIFNGMLPDGVYTRGVIKLPVDEVAVPNVAGSTWFLHYCEVMLEELYTRRVPSFYHSTRQAVIAEGSGASETPVVILQPPTPPGVSQVLVDLYVAGTATATAHAAGQAYTASRTGAGWMTITVDVRGDIYNPPEIRIDSSGVTIEAISVYSARATLP